MSKPAGKVVHWISRDPNGEGNVTACGKPFVYPMSGNGWRVRDISCPECDHAICDIVHAKIIGKATHDRP